MAEEFYTKIDSSNRSVPSINVSSDDSTAPYITIRLSSLCTLKYEARKIATKGCSTGLCFERQEEGFIVGWLIYFPNAYTMSGSLNRAATQ